VKLTRDLAARSRELADVLPDQSAAASGRAPKDQKLLDALKANKSLTVSLNSARAKADVAEAQVKELQEQFATLHAAAVPAAGEKKSRISQLQHEAQAATTRVGQLVVENSKIRGENADLRRILKRELGSADFDLDQLLEQPTRWRGRSQQIQMLKLKLQETRKALADAVGPDAAFPAPTPSSHYGQALSPSSSGRHAINHHSHDDLEADEEGDVTVTGDEGEFDADDDADAAAILTPEQHAAALQSNPAVREALAAEQRRRGHRDVDREARSALAARQQNVHEKLRAAEEAAAEAQSAAAVIKRKYDALLARRSVLESQVRDLREGMGTLAKKTKHDNELIAALRARLERGGGAATPGSYAAGTSSLAGLVPDAALARRQQEQIDRLSAQLAELRSATGGTDADLRAAQVESSRMRQLADMMKGRHDDAVAQARELEAAVRAERRRVVALERQLDRPGAKQPMSEVERRCVDLEGELAAAVDDAATRLSAAEASAAARDDEIRLLRRALDEQKQALTRDSGAGADVTMLQRQNAELRRRLNEALSGQ
jgi:chromosome segregation ATPase